MIEDTYRASVPKTLAARYTFGPGEIVIIMPAINQITLTNQRPAKGEVLDAGLIENV